MLGIVLAIVMGGAIASPAQAVRGDATWYRAPSSHDAAAGPLLRAMLGSHWRGTWVQVCHGSKCVTVVASDFCACGPRHGKPTLIDLDDDAFRKLAPLGRGVIPVVVSTVDGTLPPTDTAP